MQAKQLSWYYWTSVQHLILLTTIYSTPSTESLGRYFRCFHKMARILLTGQELVCCHIKLHLKSATLTCDVPQGSILGPLLFNLYMLPLGQNFGKNSMCYHNYANDTQIYLALSPNDVASLDTLHQSLDHVNTWMSQIQFSSVEQTKLRSLYLGTKSKDPGLLLYLAQMDLRML